jgi:glycosyltransferase involved in cell wall biosynthesis
MQIVQQTHPECELTIIGDGPLRSSLEALAGELKVRGGFRGTQPTTVVREALKTAKVFCVPSVTAANGDSEGLPTVVAEAQAMGVPVVGTMHGGIPEIVIDEVNGFLAPERDHEALADSLSALLSDEDRWSRFHHAALRRVEQLFDLRAQTALLESIYTGTIGTGPGASAKVASRQVQPLDAR